MKYKTRPIPPLSYEGCHPVIKEHLEQGLQILCYCRDGEGQETPQIAYISTYTSWSCEPYGGVAHRSWALAEPVEFGDLKTRQEVHEFFAAQLSEVEDHGSKYGRVEAHDLFDFIYEAGE